MNRITTSTTIALLALLGASTQCLAAPRSPGEHWVDVSHDGLTRRALVYVPASVGLRKVPLVMVLHGGFGDAVGTRLMSGMDAVADREGFAVVYPEGIDRHWNDGREDQRGGQAAVADDVGFIRTLVGTLVRRFEVDPERVYATGISNGSMMCHRLAVEASDVIAAFMTVAGTIPRTVAALTPPRPVPMLIVHGTEDPFCAWEGGEQVVSVSETVAEYVARNRCRTETTTRLPDADPRDGTRVLRTVHEGGRAPVVLLEVRGGGHAWPGGSGAAGLEAIAGKVSRDISASEEAWAFFADKRLAR